MIEGLKIGNENIENIEKICTSTPFLSMCNGVTEGCCINKESVKGKF